MKICISVLIGLPASGKTTFSKFLCNYNNTNNMPYNIIHIDYDDLLYSENQQKCINESGTYSDNRKSILTCVNYIVNNLLSKQVIVLNEFENSIINQIKWSNNQLNTLLLIDDNMYYRSMRYDYFKLCRESNISYCQIYIAVDLSIALKRNSERKPSAKISEDIIKRMGIRLQKPNIKNLWEHNSITINSENNFFDGEILASIRQLVNEAIKMPVIKNYITEVNVSQSNIHKMDIYLRKHLGHLVQKYIKEKKDVAFVSNELNAKRKQLLIDIRSGILFLPNEDKFEEFLKQNFCI